MKSKAGPEETKEASGREPWKWFQNYPIYILRRILTQKDNNDDRISKYIGYKPNDIDYNDDRGIY